MDEKEIIEKLEKGKLGLRSIDKHFSPKDAADVRRKFIAKKTGASLENTANYSFDTDITTKKNIENMVGVTQVPLGVAGPLMIDGDFAKGEFYIPLATTEGALVASVSRGCRTITNAGGAKVFAENKGMTRAPVFKVSGIEEGRKLVRWVEKNFLRIKKVAESTTHFGELKKIHPWISGKNVYLRFVFDTKDAMGMNMAVVACDKVVVELIEKETKAKCIALSGNMCVDKKPSFMNFIKGRGKRVHAEAIIKRKVVEKMLKAKPEEIVEVNYRKNMIGSAMAGSMGFNAHFANMVAALYIATGQDPAHAVGGSMGMTTVELEGKDLYISVYLPNVNSGTVGGGTGLATQKEALEMLGVFGAGKTPGDNAMKLAEIVGATVLAGELSVLGALATGDLARAHVALGRGK